MSAGSIATVAKMLESLPDYAQDRVAEHLREYMDDMRDELHWDNLFRDSQTKLAQAARTARQQIADGIARPMDVDAL